MCDNLDAELVALDSVESRHLSKVLRLQVGDNIKLLDGCGGVGVAKIDQTGDSVTAQILSRQHHPPPPIQLTLAVAPPKKSARLEWMIEKSTELGVATILLMLTERSERRRANQQRLQKILEAACKQSGNPYLPKLIELTPFGKAIEQCSGVDLQAICAVGQEGKQVVLAQQHLMDKSCMVMIGPEGGFTATELSLAERHGVTRFSLGDRRLRTETAALYVAGLSFLGSQSL